MGHVNGEEETECNFSMDNRQEHFVLIAKTVSSRNLEDNDSNNSINSSYDELFDKNAEILGEFLKTY